MLKRCLLVLTLLLLVGCDRVELYSNLEEQDANDMQAILLRQGIDCEKSIGKEQTFGLMVAKRQMAAAIEILKGYVFPKKKFTDMGTLFKKEGLVSSPEEDRIRFIYGLSQEVAATISQIDGVISARVHIVMPENDPLSEYFQPSSASVFIKYRQTIDIQQLIHPIKQLVVNSIEGLNYEKVSIVPFATPVITAAPPKFSRIMGIEVHTPYAGRFRLLIYGLIFFFGVLITACGYLLWRQFFRRPTASVSPTAGATSNLAQEDDDAFAV
jgi:type III secretion protein J